jgi:hypothetical protein
MAKAKKQEKDKGDGEPAEGAKKAGRAKSAPKGASKQPSKSAAPGGASGVPLIDTDLAASTAAKMLVSRAASGAQRATSGAAASAASSSPSEAEEPGEKRETSTFKQLKQNLTKPQGGGLGSVLGGPVAGKKGNTPIGGNQQVARNQTFGADVNRSGVPRRTGG